MTAIATLPGLHSNLLPIVADARRRSDELFGIVRPEAIYDRPIAERHRIIFYLGHLEAFDWNLLGRRALALDSFHPEFDKLFAFGIDPVGGGLPTDQPADWPAVESVLEYVRRIRRTLDAHLRDAMRSNREVPLLENGLALHVAIEHRLTHAETLAYMLHQLPLDRKIARPGASAPEAQPVHPHILEIPAGMATLGIRRSSGGPFGWDNEFERVTVQVPSFAIDAYKVTNGEFLRFVREGGYSHRSLWSDADWAWRESQGITQPLFWRKFGDQWFYRGMFAEIPLPLDWPVYVSHAEASAYARWAGKLLPTEMQWQRAAYGTPTGTERSFPWGEELPERSRGNFAFERWDPAPVNAYPRGASAFGVAGLAGNGWEWTSTVFGPLPGFQPFSFYPRYSAEFFDGKHFVMKGGSARTAACMLRRSFRNWFQPHYPYAYAGFRCVSP